MEKEFVTYEIALELKKLGFDEPCFGNYVKLTATQTTFFVNDVVDEINRETPLHESLITKAPTFSQVFRWFREKYDIHYSIDRECSQHDHKWGYNWSLYNYTGIFDEYLTSHPDAPAGEWVYETHEEAELACLQKLIEIVKQSGHGKGSV